MSAFDTVYPKSVDLAGSATSGVTFAGDATSPVTAIRQSTLPVQKVEVDLETLTYAMNTGAGGTADGQGQHILTLPEGAVLILGSYLNLTVTPQTGLSATGAVVSLGSAAAGDADATLSGTEADILASQTLGDGTLASATAETHNGWVAAAPALYDGSGTAAPVYLNVAGTWTEADDNPADLTVAGTVGIFYIRLGDD